MELRSKGEYYLIYHPSKNPRRRSLSVKFPSLNAPPYIKLGGKRAQDLYRHIILTLDNLGISYSIIEENPCEILKVPWATGLAITVFLLAVYSLRKPLAYIFVLDKMLTGNMPLAGHLINMTEVALDLSEHLGNPNGEALIVSKGAKTISKMMMNLLKVLHL